ncbi:MAG: hypothetical protein M3N13_09935 [Candidatus Eremiobacteraeota bacterium]|nr:hypothetical protein [Candidatus Eremiobacteraeota bacterium]
MNHVDATVEYVREMNAIPESMYVELDGFDGYGETFSLECARCHKAIKEACGSKITAFVDAHESCEVWR